ncbi:MAG: hypothetical protein ACHQX0_06180 [Desulfobaccales bacterium]
MTLEMRHEGPLALVLIARIPLKTRLFLLLPALLWAGAAFRHSGPWPVEFLRALAYFGGLWFVLSVTLTEIRVTALGVSLGNPVAGSSYVAWRELAAIQTGRVLETSRMNSPVLVRFIRKDGKRAFDLGIHAWKERDLVQLLWLAKEFAAGLVVDKATRRIMEQGLVGPVDGYLDARPAASS